jgi:transcriptional regulator with XRE-family HTH domain
VSSRVTTSAVIKAFSFVALFAWTTGYARISQLVKEVSMAESALSAVLRRLREGRGLSLREVSQLSGLDHAYIYRLETGEKEAPSDEALARLFRALRPTSRQERVVRFLVGREVSVDLVDSSIIDDPSIALEDFESAAQMSFRGKRPTTSAEWRTAIERIRKLREDLEGG